MESSLRAQAPLFSFHNMDVITIATTWAVRCHCICTLTALRYIYIYPVFLHVFNVSAVHETLAIR